MLEILHRRWQLKLLALAIAFFIWLSITGQDRTVRDFTVPLEIALDAGKVSAQPLPTAVTLRLEGPRITIRRLDALDLAVRVDLNGAPTGRRGILLTRDLLHGVPPGVDVTMFQPARIEVDIARRSERRVPVVPSWDGEPGAGFELYGWRIEPDRIRVSGPRELVAALEGLATERIAIAGRTTSLRSAVSLLPQGQQLSVEEPARIELRVHIGAAAARRVVHDLPVNLDSDVGETARVRPERVSVTLVGPPEAIAGVEPDRIVVTADLRGPQDGPSIRVPLKAGLDVPENLRPFLRVETIRPAQVDVEWIEKESM